MLENMIVDLSRFDWQGISAVSDLLMVVLNIILIVSVIIGYKSLRESVLSRDATLLIWAIEKMSTIKTEINTISKAPNYGTIEEIKKSNFVSPWSSEEEAAAQKVSVELQRLAYIANSGLISKTHFKKMWGKTFADSWIKLEIWVKHKRLKNNEPIELKDGSFSRNDFEKFAMEK